MKHEHPHHPPKHEPPKVVVGTYRHAIYSPKGGLEGLLLDVDGTPTQIVLDPHEASLMFDGIAVGQKLKLEASPAKPSPKGEPVHKVFRFFALLSVDDKKPRGSRMPERFKGRVARLNYAKHGEPNGVVLDSGDFIHLRPRGFRDAQLKIGDTVSAIGEAKRMTAGGFVVEATEVNGVVIEPKK